MALMRTPSQRGPVSRHHLGVVIPVHDNSWMMPRILDALAAQAGMAGRRWHVVVVNNGSPEGLPQAIRATTFPFRLTVVDQRHTGEAWARNQGWKQADAPVVLFLDDDMVPGERLLAEHLRAHASHPGAVVLGLITPDAAAGPRPWLEYDCRKMTAKYAALAACEKPSGIHAGGNFSVPVEVLERTGGFDHRIPGRDHIDLGFRLRQIGVPFVYWPAAHAREHVVVDYATWRVRHSLQGRLDVALFRDRGYGGGLLSMVACFHDRHPMNRMAVRIALSADGVGRAVIGAAAAVGEVTFRIGLRGASTACMSVIANTLYWRGVRDGLRGNFRFWQLVRTTRNFRGRTYQNRPKAAT